MTPAGPLRPVGLVYADSTGRLYIRRGSVERVPPGGAPAKRLRDVAIALHLDYLTACERMRPGAARSEVAALFGLAKPDNVRTIAKRVHAEAFAGRRFLAVAGRPADRFMASLVAHSDGAVEGYAVRWGDLVAEYGRGTLTLRPDGADLDLEAVPLIGNSPQ